MILGESDGINWIWFFLILTSIVLSWRDDAGEYMVTGRERRRGGGDGESDI